MSFYKQHCVTINLAILGGGDNPAQFENSPMRKKLGKLQARGRLNCFSSTPFSQTLRSRTGYSKFIGVVTIQQYPVTLLTVPGRMEKVPKKIS